MLFSPYPLVSYVSAEDVKCCSVCFESIYIVQFYSNTSCSVKLEIWLWKFIYDSFWMYSYVLKWIHFRLTALYNWLDSYYNIWSTNFYWFSGNPQVMHPHHPTMHLTSPALHHSSMPNLSTAVLPGHSHPSVQPQTYAPPPPRDKWRSPPRVSHLESQPSPLRKRYVVTWNFML